MMKTDRLMSLVSLIEAEAYGNRRKFRLINIARRMKLEIKKMNRRNE